ncbi:MAG: Protein translocase subunit SecY [candidate division TM6 bacterium GW2011_GWF2_32_72]|nr:MAG: Protein translocase subunit SecY [candidate division TM6 bacterium GW2011_GWF2_32_72]
MLVVRNFKNIFAIPELTKKLAFTLGVLILYRLGDFIPIVGIDVAALAQQIAQKSSWIGGALGFMNTMTAGALDKGALFALGIGPYITASIAMQFLTLAIPELEQLQKEGAYGRRKIEQYTRYLTLGLSILQGSMYLGSLHAMGVVLNPGIGFTIMTLLSLAAGSMFVMWLGEQITAFGIGNGSSMLIFAGIVARFPNAVFSIWHQVFGLGQSPLILILVPAIFVAITACIVFLEKGERKIPVQYARRVVGNRVYGGQSTYIPFKINPSGVMPVIFAGTVLNVPLALLSYFATKFTSLKWLAVSVGYGQPLNLVITFLLIIFFAFFYTALIFDPNKLSEDMKKSGGFIPGVRPGKQTADFFDYILTRVGLVGAIYLGALAVVPTIINVYFGLPLPFAGTSLLIVVGVALDFSAQVESYLLEHRYEGFLSSGRLKGRATR